MKRHPQQSIDLAIKRVRAGETAASVARSINVSATTVRRWVQAHEPPITDPSRMIREQAEHTHLADQPMDPDEAHAERLDVQQQLADVYQAAGVEPPNQKYVTGDGPEGVGSAESMSPTAGTTGAPPAVARLSANFIARLVHRKSGDEQLAEDVGEVAEDVLKAIPARRLVQVAILGAAAYATTRFMRSRAMRRAAVAPAPPVATHQAPPAPRQGDGEPTHVAPSSTPTLDGWRSPDA
jgi:hypothetical protein